MAAFTFADWEADLARRLAGPLPGERAHLTLSPQPRSGWKPGRVPDDARPAAALMLWYPDESGEPTLLLTRRRPTMPTHAGQLSFPGGGLEKGESLQQCAIRESMEEVGLDPVGLRVLGALTPLHIPISGFVLHPFVAVVGQRPVWNPAADEVEEIFEPTLERFDDPGHYGNTTRRFGDLDLEIPYFDVGGARLWGATAMITAEFLALLERGSMPPEADR
jgi:8-oxo-dGTP pyrophosphatase MutT (NUDIX family)